MLELLHEVEYHVELKFAIDFYIFEGWFVPHVKFVPGKGNQ